MHRLWVLSIYTFVEALKGSIKISRTLWIPDTVSPISLQASGDKSCGSRYGLGFTQHGTPILQKDDEGPPFRPKWVASCHLSRETSSAGDCTDTLGKNCKC